MNLVEMRLVFEARRIKEKLNFGSEIAKKLDGLIRDTDFSIEGNKEEIRNMCRDLEMFLKEN
jgi:hypothetical protein